MRANATITIDEERSWKKTENKKLHYYKHVYMLTKKLSIFMILKSNNMEKNILEIIAEQVIQWFMLIISLHFRLRFAARLDTCFGHLSRSCLKNIFWVLMNRYTARCGTLILIRILHKQT